MTTGKKVWRAYLAGPEVFLPDPAAAAESLRALCARHGIVGVFPLDGAVKAAPGEPPAAHAARIRAANLDLIRATDLVLANASPFRGPSADDGTAYEMGFATALGRPVFAYADTDASLLERTGAHFALARDGGGVWRDPEGRMVEDFGLGANLMLTDPVVRAWGVAGPHGLYQGAEAAVAAAAAWIAAQSPA
ncbi:nucleoside 2-deoxyribosyltransferase [Nitrospirillum sp. BR 11163]|uniref:nucleoside 2-deoxyribosyltransferase n=1 Tax=Nitrospirillum sp. BR 11163 TaxID=3104323 RepID=UPI002AFE7986|nr:nucleoside 2-deoxyribosyltransferase [Nitrospirillum sp. BR 11163]MEA1674409.1 nucleoside 2-deoxyribosyltransferase [Nitrospirillum sp. BR 11163]